MDDALYKCYNTIQYNDSAAGKLKRKSFNLSSTPKSSRIDQLISWDVRGPVKVPSIREALYCSNFRDDCSDYQAAYFLKANSEVAVQRFYQSTSHTDSGAGNIYENRRWNGIRVE
jgi:hypothetical protein